MMLFSYLPSFLISKVLSYSGSDNSIVATMFRTNHQFRKRVMKDQGGSGMIQFPVHQNQWTAAKSVYQEFSSGKRYVVLTAQPQSGKTGACMGVVYLVHHYLGYGSGSGSVSGSGSGSGSHGGLPIDPRNIWFVCGMNDSSLKRQQIREFAGLIPPDQILFSKDLEKIRRGRSHLITSGRLDFHNSLVIIDESHYAQAGDEEFLGKIVEDGDGSLVRKKPQASLVHQFVQSCVGASLDGDKSKWLSQDMFVLSVSATPMSEMAHFLGLSGDLKGQVVLEPGRGYYGFSKMVELNRVRPSYYLGLDESRDKLVLEVREMWKKQVTSGNFGYAIMRFSNTGEGRVYRGQFMAKLKEAGVEVKWINFHSQERKKNGYGWVTDINQIVRHRPSVMTFIEVYNTLRAGYQLDTRHVFMVHDSPGAMTDVTAQGLAGRCCGYGKEKDDVVVYCHDRWLRLYVDFLENKFDPHYVPSHSKNIRRGHVDILDRGKKFEARVPSGGKMGEHLIRDLVRYKKLHGNRYPKFLEEFGDRIRGLGFIDDGVWSSAQFVGVTILDGTNKTEGRTNTWAKFWDPALKAFRKGKRGAYFRGVRLDEKVNDFKYLFVNLKEGHPEYGWLLMTSQCRLSSLGEDEWIQTTGKEEFHPRNNRMLVSAT